MGVAATNGVVRCPCNMLQAKKDKGSKANKGALQKKVEKALWGYIVNQYVLRLRHFVKSPKKGLPNL